MAMPTNVTCDCEIEYEGDAFKQEWSIQYCPLHAATAAQRDWLLEVVAEARRVYRHVRPQIFGVDAHEEMLLAALKPAAAQPETREAK